MKQEINFSFINEDGKFAKKVYVICIDKDSLHYIINGLSKNNKLKATNYKDLNIPSKGFIVYLRQTLMQLGEIVVSPYTDSKLNKLIFAGYTDIYNFTN